MLNSVCQLICMLYLSKKKLAKNIRFWQSKSWCFVKIYDMHKMQRLKRLTPFSNHKSINAYLWYGLNQYLRKRYWSVNRYLFKSRHKIGCFCLTYFIGHNKHLSTKSSNFKLFIERIICDQNGNSVVTPSLNNAMDFFYQHNVKLSESFQYRQMDTAIDSSLNLAAKIRKNLVKISVKYIANISRWQPSAQPTKRANVTQYFGVAIRIRCTRLCIYITHTVLNTPCIPWNTM